MNANLSAKSRCAAGARLRAVSTVATLLLPLWGLSACSSSAPLPRERYYLLQPQPGAPVPVAPHAAVPLLLVETPNLYGVYSERPLLHRADATSSALQQYDYVLWAEPPETMLGDVLLADLRSTFGAERAQPLAAGSAQPPTAWRVNVRVRRFEQVLTADGAAAAAYAATYSVRDAQGGLRLSFEFARQAEAGSTAPAPFVAAMDRLIAAADAELVTRLQQVAVTP